MIRSILHAMLFAIILLVGTPGSTADQKSPRQPVDLALVLATDISGSMTEAEITLQRNAYMTALRDPRVISAIQLGRHGRIALAYVEWSRQSLQIPVLPFRVVGTAEEAEAAARALSDWSDLPRSAQRPHSGGGTGIGSALSFAHELLEASSYRAAPWVVDISGDGINNDGPAPDQPRDRLVASGAVVNGLPIATDLAQNDAEALERYYARCVIGGIGAFQLVVADASRLAETLTFKLVIEIAGLVPPEMHTTRILLASDTPDPRHRSPC